MIISGKDIAAKYKAKMKEDIKLFSSVYGGTPCLAVIIVGNNPASQSYVKGKSKACEEVGINNITIELPENTSETELLEKID